MSELISPRDKWISYKPNPGNIPGWRPTMCESLTQHLPDWVREHKDKKFRDGVTCALSFITSNIQPGAVLREVGTADFQEMITLAALRVRAVIDGTESQAEPYYTPEQGRKS